MNFSKLSNQELIAATVRTAANERQYAAELLQYLKEIAVRKAYLEMGYGSLYEFVVKHLKYSESAASRRIRSMEMSKEQPEVIQKISDGTLSMTALAKVQTVMKAHEKLTGEKISFDQKEILLEQIESKSTVETQELLFQVFPEASAKIERSKRIQLDGTTTQINLPNEVLKDIERTKELLAHTLPGADLNEVIKHVFKEFLKKKDPMRDAAPILGVSGSASQVRPGDICSSEARMSLTDFTSAAAKPCVIETSVEKSIRNPASVTQKRHNKIQPARRSISMKLKKRIWRESKGECSYQDPISKRKCTSRHFLEVDHVQPIAAGGGNNAENLRLLCRQHNQWRIRR